jgi:transposase-like protein
VIPKPEHCPCCNGKNSLIGHSWYKRKGLSGHPAGYLAFWIKRFLCKICLKTISIHPTFSSTYKRFYFPFVIDCMVQLFEKLKSMYAVAKENNIAYQTLWRWKKSFSDTHKEVKRICFVNTTGPPLHLLSEICFNFFRTQQNGTIHDGAVVGMISLSEQFKASLY